MTLQVASHRIVENLYRCEVVVDLQVIANPVTGARCGGRTYCDGGSVVVEREVALHLRSADLVLCRASRNVLDLQVAAHNSVRH